MENLLIIVLVSSVTCLLLGIAAGCGSCRRGKAGSHTEPNNSGLTIQVDNISFGFIYSWPFGAFGCTLFPILSGGEAEPKGYFI